MFSCSLHRMWVGLEWISARFRASDCGGTSNVMLTVDCLCRVSGPRVGHPCTSRKCWSRACTGYIRGPRPMLGHAIRL
jgi:hypothetical protein